jgi:hypothetical protein
MSVRIGESMEEAVAQVGQRLDVRAADQGFVGRCAAAQPLAVE